ncbi:MAG: ABC transporter ATP-binding protein [Nitrososphaerota archaeon]
MLRVNDVSVSYGKIQVLWHVSLYVGENEIVALIGANGAGKTTLLNAISGLVKISSGRIEFMGRRIDGLSPHKIVEMGIAHIPEGGRLFTEMSVRENLEIGAFPLRAWKERGNEIKKIRSIFPSLRDRQLARTLSGGERQMVAIARGLMSKPTLCLFDEPSYGLAPVVVKEVMHVIKSLPGRGISVLLVEQNVNIALEVADRGYVLENGRIVLEGQSEELLQTELIKKAYLGM